MKIEIEVTGCDDCPYSREKYENIFYTNRYCGHPSVPEVTGTYRYNYSLVQCPLVKVKNDET